MQDSKSETGSDGRLDPRSQSESTLRVNESDGPQTKKGEDVDGLGWDGPNDPLNPVNWSLSKKWIVMGSACFMYVFYLFSLYYQMFICLLLYGYSPSLSPLYIQRGKEPVVLEHILFPDSSISLMRPL